MSSSRRSFLASLASAASAASAASMGLASSCRTVGCRSCESPSPAAPGATEPPPAVNPRGGAWKLASFATSFPGAPEGERAFLLNPWSEGAGGTAGDAPRPEARSLLVALHGRGEAERGLDVGAGAWPNEYQLDRVHRRLLSPPLVARDLVDMTNDAQLARLNASLAASPYRGIALACPYTPHLADQSPDGSAPFARFVIDELLPKLRGEVGSTAPREATGIDGVSMGGRLALFVGLMHPEVFGVVGAVQPALGVEEAPLVSRLARAAMEKAKVTLRLVTSEEDYFLNAVRAASARLTADGVPHELLVVPGNHGYEFNRGPGGAEMLVWHERAQRERG